ncbi:MAG: LamG domain-containing protein, partial [Firmicutes bacterium]|nr:LamG domain-containing protein [Bacillota bacterium]
GDVSIGSGSATEIVDFNVNGTVTQNNGAINVSDYSKFNHSGSWVVTTGNAVFGKHAITTIRSLTLSAGSLMVNDSSTFNGHHLHVNYGNASIGNNVTFYDYGEFRINQGSLTIGDNTSFRQDHHTLWVAVGNLEVGTNSTFWRYGGNTYVRDGDLLIGNNSNYKSQSHTQINNGSFIIGDDATFRIEGGYNNQIWNGDFTLGANTTYWSQGHTYLYTGTFNWNNSNPIENYGTIYLNSGDFHLTAGVSFISTNSLQTLNGNLIVDAGVTATIQGTVQLTNGSIDLDPTANLTWWANLYLRSTFYAQYDINSGGRDLKRIEITGTHYDTEYNFTDDVKASSDGIFMYANKTNFNGHGVDVYHFYSWTGGLVKMDLTGTDTVYVRSQFRMYPSTNTQLTLGDATIKWIGTDNYYMFAGSNITYNDLYFNSDNTGSTFIQFEGSGSTLRDVFINAKGTQYLNLNNNFTVRNLTLDYLSNYTATPNLNFNGNWNVTGIFKVQGPATIKNNIYSYANNTFNIFDVQSVNQWILRANTTQTFTELKPIIGTCDKTISIKGETFNAQGTFNMASGTFNGDWLILQDVNATGAGSFIADNTVDLGNVSGWTVNTIAPRDFYWVGNSGNWNVAGNWSETSGGAAGVCGVPNRTDNAIFDANSFSASGQYVNINVEAECKNMTWDGVTAGSGITGGSNLNIYGSLELDSDMAFNHSGTFYFQSITTGNTIKTNGVQMHQTIFRGQNLSTGEWSLLDDFNAHNHYLYFERGTFRSNGHNIDVHSFYNWTGQVANIYFSQTDTSYVKVQYEFRIYPTSNVNVYADSTDIIFENNNNHMYFYSGDYDAQYRDIIFNSNANAGYYIHMQYPNKARDIKVTCAGNQYMYFYDQKEARNVTINYLNGSPNGQWIQMNGSNTFESLTINGNGNNRPTVYLHGNNSLGDVSFSNLAGLYFGGLQTMTSFTPLSGQCDKLLNFWGGNGVSMASGIFEVNWATMSNLSASGGATFNANNILGTLTNINGFNLNLIPPTNFYWVGGSGNWTDPNHWSYTSGGTPGVCPVPGRFDNVFFDVNSFTAPNQYVNLNTTAEFNNMLWNNVNFPRLIGGGQMNAYGSFQLDPKLSYEASGWLYFRSKTAGNVIKTAGKKLYYVRFDGEGQSTGEWTLKDDLSLHYDLYIDRGTFVSDSSNISARMFYCWTGSPTTVDLTGTEFVKVTNQFRIYPNSFNLIMDKADVIFTGTDQFYFIGGQNTFNDIIMTATNTGNTYIEFQYNNIINNVKITASGYQTIRFYHNSTYNDIDIEYQNPSTNIPYFYLEGSNTINDLSITSIGNAGPYIYMNGNNTFNNLVTAGVGTRLYPRGNTTQTVNDALAIGSGGFPVFFQSQTQGQQATFYKPSGTVCLDYVWMRDIKATTDLDALGQPKTDFFAGNNSVDLGNNSNWTFSSCDGYYWVGGTGNWSNPNHWATSSGGTQLHGSLPTQFDNVFFDANSFTTAGEVVTVDLADPRANNMSWSSSLFTPTLVGTGDLNIYGSLRFISNMNMNFTGSVNFKSDQTGNEINTGGHSLTDMSFIGGNDGEGEWKLVNHLDVLNAINLSNGSFNTNGKEVSTKEFNSTSINTRTLNLGASTVTINDGQWNPSGLTNFTFNKGTSKIIITGTTASDFMGAGLAYNDVTFNTPEELASRLTGANTFNVLRFDAGVTVTMDAEIQEANQIKAIGSCARNITLLSATPGSAATLKQVSGNVDGKFLTLTDNTATGGATFSANLSNDLGNVNGWSFTSAPVISIMEETGLVDCELNNDGWAKVTVTAGTPPFSYLWSTSETTPMISGLIPGTYYVTVTDSVGCSITEAIDVLNKPSALEPIGFTVSDDKICLGTPIEFAAGNVISNALTFDGSDDYVEIGNQTSLSPTSTHPITFEAWINPASNASGIIASKYNHLVPTNSNFYIGLNNGKIVATANGTDVVESINTVAASDWSHVAVVFEPGSGKTIIYINGAYDNSGSLSYNSGNGSSSFVLGSIASGTLSNHYFNGKMDEVRVWDTVISAAD